MAFSITGSDDPNLVPVQFSGKTRFLSGPGRVAHKIGFGPSPAVDGQWRVFLCPAPITTILISESRVRMDKSRNLLFDSITLSDYPSPAPTKVEIRDKEQKMFREFV
jgi:hypothetical protein